jgi:hypothetical protein
MSRNFTSCHNERPTASFHIQITELKIKKPPPSLGRGLGDSALSSSLFRMTLVISQAKWVGTDSEGFAEG